MVVTLFVHWLGGARRLSRYSVCRDQASHTRGREWIGQPWESPSEQCAFRGHVGIQRLELTEPVRHGAWRTDVSRRAGRPLRLGYDRTEWPLHLLGGPCGDS